MRAQAFGSDKRPLRAGFWAKDRGVPTTLLTEIGELWGAKSLGEIVEMGNARPGPDFPALAPLVARCADEGDELAAAVLERAGIELAEQVALVALKMKESGGKGKIEAAYTGSVLEHISLVRSAMICGLEDLSARTSKVVEGAVDPLEGALWRAREAGKSIDASRPKPCFASISAARNAKPRATEVNSLPGADPRRSKSRLEDSADGRHKARPSRQENPIHLARSDVA